MTIRFSCPECGANLLVPDNMAGRMGKCKKCGASVAAPPGAGNHQPADGNATQAASTGTITYRCNFCRETLESDRSLAGGQDTCPSCGKTTTVPPKSTVGAGAFFSKVPKSVYIGGAAVILVALVSFASWLALRDTWERDHGTELRQKSEVAILLIRDGKQEEGIAKYHELIAFVGDRQLRDPSLRQDMLRAKDVAESARKQLEEQRLQVLLRKEKELKDKLHQEVQGRWRLASGDEDNQMFATFTEKDLSIVTIILGKRETSSFPYAVVKAVGDRAIRIQHTGSLRTDLLTLAPDGTKLSMLIEIDRSGTKNDGIVETVASLLRLLFSLRAR